MRATILLVVIISSTLFNCKSKENNPTGAQKDSVDVKQSTIEYTCPMHPDVVTNKPGSCPRCGMELLIRS